MDRRKELKAQYKARKVVGGIYRINNKENGCFYLQYTDDMQATHNWFGSCCMLGTCTLPPIQEDWKKFGKDAFSVEELDLLEKKQEQSATEFREDLKILLELWSEKLPKENRY